MEQDTIKRNEFNEYTKRMEAEHDRQNHRINVLEETTKRLGELHISVNELAITMKQMLEEQKSQGQRLGELESRDGKMWRTVTSHIITCIVGAIVCYAITRIGL